jgi:hypothetical protein
LNQHHIQIMLFHLQERLNIHYNNNKRCSIIKQTIIMTLTDM